jgi:dCMP deaminase
VTQLSTPLISPTSSPLNDRLIPRPDWDEYFMAIAKVISTRSTCSSRPVGCVIVKDHRILVAGYNGAPPGEPHCTDGYTDGHIYCARRAQNIPDHLKQQVCPSVHAEENALNLATKLGISHLLSNSSIYTTLAPCNRCINNLKASGVTKVYYELAYESVDPERDREWKNLALSAFEVYQEIRISQASTRKINGAISDLTSERLLPSG